MPNYQFTIEGVSGQLQVVSFHGEEGLSKLYSFEVRVACDQDLLASTSGESQYLRAKALLRMDVDNHPRFVRGIVASIVPEGETLSVSGAQPKQLWRIRLVPRLWLAKKRVNSRIFQRKTTLEIVSEILTGIDYHSIGVEIDLPKTEYPDREYCMQYRETDYAFIRRILSEEGILYYFDHRDTDSFNDVERLVLRDQAEYPPLHAHSAPADDPPDTLFLPAQAPTAMPSDQHALASFELEHAVKPNSVLLRDYDYERPRLDVTASAPNLPRSTTPYQNDANAVERWDTWESTSRGQLGTDDAAERAALQEPARTAQLRVYESHSPLGPERVAPPLADARLEEHKRDKVNGRGVGFCRHLAPGYVFAFRSDVLGVTNFDQEYVATHVEHSGVEDGSTGLLYQNQFRCVPKTVCYRPKLKVKARREILESAVVVGPVGNDIHTDRMGRIRIQFQWDLTGSMNENSSCWVRVVQPWSGSAFGTQFIPRVGTEVMVSFREGDHDRPVVMGCVYNGAQPPPFLPPEGTNISGFRTRSTPGGNGYNELSFDDTSGDERVRLRAQTDLETYVGRDRKTIVRGSDITRTEGHRAEEIEENVLLRVGGDHAVQIDGAHKDVVKGNSETKVGEDRLVEVEGSERHHIGRTGSLKAADDLTTETEGNQATVIGKHDAKRSFALHVEGRSFLESTEITELASKSGLRLRSGRSVIEVMPDQILLMSDKIMLQAPGVQMEVRKNGELWIDADEAVVAKSKSVTMAGQSAMLRLKTQAELLGAQIKLQGAESLQGLDAETREPTKIELKDDDGNAVPNQRYILVFSDGSEQTGFLDHEGKGEVFLDDGATIRFPGLLDAARGGTR
ncbi:MAG: type VI secretion system tip protein TssI/VgrG [Polyangiaceae bacterium]